MNKYKIKIVQENGMHVGYALLNNEIAFKTEPFGDSISASRKIATLISENRPPAPIIRATDQKASSIPISYTAANPTRPAKKCCGRG